MPKEGDNNSQSQDANSDEPPDIPERPGPDPDLYDPTQRVRDPHRNRRIKTTRIKTD